MAQNFENLLNLFEDVEKEEFYGTLSFNFQKGKLKVCKKEELLLGAAALVKDSKFKSEKSINTYSMKGVDLLPHKTQRKNRSEEAK